jgi:imidazolonepropionase-like amidohydrolase
MDQERLLTNQTVLVEGGWITALGPTHQIRVPAGAVQIDGRGKFLIPGLADMHAHVFHFTHNGVDAPEADSAGAEERLFRWLADGVTTIRDMDYYSEEVGKQALRLRALSASGKVWMPRIYTAGLWASSTSYIAGGSPQFLGLAMDSIAGFIAAYKAKGYDFIKVHSEAPEVLDSVLAAAKRVGIPVVGHVPPGARVEHILPLGYTSIEHPYTDYTWGNHRMQDLSDTTGIWVLVAKIKDAGIWHCPTQAHYDRLHGSDPRLLKVDQASGVRLLIGTDEFPWPEVITRELQAFVAGGLTPYQALVAGTRNVAQYFGTLDQSGTITVGKRADMVLLTGNPLKNVRNTAKPAGVMIGGRWLPREEIDRRLAALKTPPPEYTPDPLLDVR